MSSSNSNNAVHQTAPARKARRSYTVRRGDCLSRIARERGAVRQADGSVSYAVRSGDHLSKIAARFGVDFQSLLRANPHLWDHPDDIYPGDPITIPAVGDRWWKSVGGLAPMEPAKSRRAVELDVHHVSQSPRRCLDAAKQMVDDYAARAHLELTDAGAAGAIWMAAGELRDGRPRLDTIRTVRGMRYLDRALDRRAPCIVGVSHRDGTGNYDGVTDHFVVVTGRGRDRDGPYYSFLDPASSESDKHRGKFRVDARGSLVKSGDPKARSVVDRRYGVSCVRRHHQLS